MKKIILSVAFCLATILAQASYVKSNPIVISDYIVTVTNDTTLTHNTITNITNIQTDLGYKYNISFYNVDRIVITNKKCASVLIVNSNGEIVAQTTENIDIHVPVGNYKVYSTIKIASKTLNW